MGRIRTFKPEYSKHEGLYDAERESGLPLRLSFFGMWPHCDREGRFKWRPRQLKSDVLPYDDIDFALVLDALEKYGFIQRYEIDGEVYGCVPTWNEHQRIPHREPPSTIPAPEEHCSSTAEALPQQCRSTAEAQPKHCSSRAEGKGMGREWEGKGIDSDQFEDNAELAVYGIAKAYPKLSNKRNYTEIPQAIAFAIIEAIHRDGESMVLNGTRAYAKSLSSVKFAEEPYKFFSGFHYELDWSVTDGQQPTKTQQRITNNRANLEEGLRQFRAGNSVAGLDGPDLSDGSTVARTHKALAGDTRALPDKCH